MKTRLFSFCACSVFFSLMVPAVLSAGGKSDADVSKTVTVYAYDSFTADWGPAPELARLFAEKTGMTVEFVSCGDAAQVLSRAVMERKSPGADVLVGIDNNLLPAARSAGVLTAYKPAGSDAVDSSLLLSGDWLLTPYDWGYFAFIFDTASSVRRPENLEDLCSPEYKGKIILMDPRTSTPGIGFLAWTMGAYGDRWTDYWSRLKDNVLTLAPGWDTGYGLFTSGEAPLVISYTTSPAYHLEYEQTERYQALVFPEGHAMQIEGLGLVKGAANPEGGKAFIDFMLTDEAQAVLPLTQWMYPVSASVELPASYRLAPRAEKTVTAPVDGVGKAVNQAVSILGR